MSFSRLASAYGRYSETRPLFSAVASTCIIFGSGDALTQLVFMDNSKSNRERDALE